jgi:tight adherence protein B
MRPGEFLVLAAAAAVAASVVLLALIGPIGAVIALIATPLVARSIISIRASRRRRAFDDQLPDVLQLIISALRSGHSLPQALDAVARQAAEPARTEFERVMFETRVGRDLGESLNATAERMQSKSFEWVVSALEINREVGGELAQVLATVAETIRERQQLERQIQTLTAEGRMSAYILTALPLVMIAALSLINPGYFEPMKSAPGPAIIVSSIMLLGIGWVWMQRLIKAEI